MSVLHSVGQMPSLNFVRCGPRLACILTAVSFLVLPDRLLVIWSGFLTLGFAVSPVTRLDLRERVRCWHELMHAATAAVRRDLGGAESAGSSAPQKPPMSGSSPNSERRSNSIQCSPPYRSEFVPYPSFRTMCCMDCPSPRCGTTDAILSRDSHYRLGSQRGRRSQRAVLVKGLD